MLFRHPKMIPDNLLRVVLTGLLPGFTPISKTACWIFLVPVVAASLRLREKYLYTLLFGLS